MTVFLLGLIATSSARGVITAFLGPQHGDPTLPRVGRKNHEADDLATREDANTARPPIRRPARREHGEAADLATRENVNTARPPIRRPART